MASEALSSEENADLFGPAPRQVVKSGARVTGYAANPGSGPAGETCKSCDHKQTVRLASKSVLKCGIGYQSGCSATDIKASAPACRLWERKL